MKNSENIRNVRISEGPRSLMYNRKIIVQNNVRQRINIMNKIMILHYNIR